MNQIKKTSLNRHQQKLIELMQQINFGRISNIPVVGGNPEFTLKQEVLSLFEHLTRMGDGTIRHLEIKHGLPFLIRIEERAA
jgi:hypothetical protein